MSIYTPKQNKDNLVNWFSGQFIFSSDLCISSEDLLKEYNRFLESNPTPDPNCPNYTKYFYNGQFHDMTYSRSCDLYSAIKKNLQYYGYSHLVYETKNVIKKKQESGYKDIYLKQGITVARLLEEEKENPKLFKETHQYSQYRSIDSLAYNKQVYTGLDQTVKVEGEIVDYTSAKINGVKLAFKCPVFKCPKPEYSNLVQYGIRYHDRYPNEFKVTDDDTKLKKLIDEKKLIKGKHYEIINDEYILKKPKWVITRKRDTKYEKVMKSFEAKDCMTAVKDAIESEYPIVRRFNFINFFRDIPGGNMQQHYNAAKESVESHLFNLFVKNAQSYKKHKRDLLDLINNFEHEYHIPFFDKIYINDSNFSINMIYNRYFKTVVLKPDRYGTNFEFKKLQDMYKSLSDKDQYNSLKEVIRGIDKCKDLYDEMKMILDQQPHIKDMLDHSINYHIPEGYQIVDEVFFDRDMNPDSISKMERRYTSYFEGFGCVHSMMEEQEFKWEEYEEKDRIEKQLLLYTLLCLGNIYLGEYHLCFFSIDDMYHLICNNYIEKFKNLHKRLPKETDEEFEKNKNKSEFEYIADELKYDRMVTSIMRDYNIDDTKEYIKKQIEIIRQQKQNI